MGLQAGKRPEFRDTPGRWWRGRESAVHVELYLSAHKSGIISLSVSEEDAGNRTVKPSLTGRVSECT